MLPCSFSAWWGACRVARRAVTSGWALALALVMLATVLPVPVHAQDTTRARDAAKPDTVKKRVRTEEVTIDGDGIRIGGKTTPGTPGVPPVPAPPGVPDIDIDIDHDSDRHGGDVVRFGDHVRIGKDEVIAGDVVVIGGSIDVEGRVSGDVVAIGGEINVHDGAVVNGEAVCVGGPVNQDEGAEIRGEVVSMNFGGPFGVGGIGRRHTIDHRSPFEFFGSFFAIVIGLAVMCGIACVLLLVFGKQIERISTTIARDPFKSGAIGLLTVVALPPTIFLVAVTVIGIPAAIVLGLLWFLGNVFGFVGVSLATGMRLTASRPAWRSPYIATGFGILVLSALFVLGVLVSKTGIPLPTWIFKMSGLLVLSAASLIGLGAVVTTRFGRRGPATGHLPPGSSAPMPTMTPPPTPAPEAPAAPGVTAPFMSAAPGAPPVAPGSPSVPLEPAEDLRKRWDPSYRDPAAPGPEGTGGEGTR